MKLHEDIIHFINTYWRPNQDNSYIVIEKTSEHYSELLDWFNNNNDFKINIGPFVGIKPYGMFDDEENPKTRTEFLFIYDDIDHTKFEKQHLTI